MKPIEYCVVLSVNTDNFIGLLSKNQEFEVRTDIYTEEDFKLFFKNITTAANVKFHQYFKNSNVKQYVYSESFVCHQSGLRSTKKDQGYETLTSQLFLTSVTSLFVKLNQNRMFDIYCLHFFTAVLLKWQCVLKKKTTMLGDVTNICPSTNALFRCVVSIHIMYNQYNQFLSLRRSVLPRKTCTNYSGNLIINIVYS